MAFIAENLILETNAVALATSDAVVLGGTLPGYFTFASKYAAGDQCHYVIRAVDIVGRPTGQVEVGRGTIAVNAGVYSLQRNSVFRSSSADALVAFSAGTKYVTVASVAPTSDVARFDIQTTLGLDFAGMVAYFPVTTPPSGWLKANGATISRATYSRLFARLGTAYGAGDGSTTFTLPDVRGEFMRGFDDGRGLDTGRTLGSVQAGGVLSHSHGVTDPTHAHSVYDPGHAHQLLTHGVNAVTGMEGNTVGPLLHIGASFVNSATTTVVSNTAIYGAATGISVQAAGITENRPRNISFSCFIKF